MRIAIELTDWAWPIVWSYVHGAAPVPFAVWLKWASMHRWEASTDNPFVQQEAA